MVIRISELIGVLGKEVVGSDLRSTRILNIVFLEGVVVIVARIVEIQSVVTSCLEDRVEVCETIGKVVEEGDFVELNLEFG